MSEPWYLKYIVKHNGVEKLIISHRLVKSQNCEENLNKIKAMHVTRLDIEQAMENTRNEEELHKLGKDWTMTQFQLQKLWKFPEDEKYHRFWVVPRCRCPQVDNEDRYPSDTYIISHDCPVHGPTLQELQSMEQETSPEPKNLWEAIKGWLK